MYASMLIELTLERAHSAGWNIMMNVSLNTVNLFNRFIKDNRLNMCTDAFSFLILQYWSVIYYLDFILQGLMSIILRPYMISQARFQYLYMGNQFSLFLHSYFKWVSSFSFLYLATTAWYRIHIVHCFLLKVWNYIWLASW